MERSTAAFILDPFEAAYAQLSESELASRAEQAVAHLSHCALCPRDCGVNRWEGQEGACETGRYARITSAFAHHGEEGCLRGSHGSGTIFFGSCSLRCVFCQNCDISHARTGATAPPSMLADTMLELQGHGCHNINFVTPSHVVPQIVEVIAEAVSRGLNVPIVYNSSAYDNADTLRLLDGLVDIYMPDFKFWTEETAGLLCDAPDYPQRAREAIAEMHRQTGVLRFGPDGIARRGVLVRHLVMPGQVEESIEIFQWLARELSPDTFVNIMRQYRPEHLVRCDTRYVSINRPPEGGEMDAAYAAARETGLWRFDRPQP